MSDLTHEQKRLLFDYCFDLTNKTETAQAKRLIDASTEAKNLCAKIKSTLAPLKSLNKADCPASLLRKTITNCTNHNHLPVQRISRLAGQKNTFRPDPNLGQ